MIRYLISLPELEALIDAEKATWRTRAKVRTDIFRAKGIYEEDSPIWSEIKVVYMRIQTGKCAYCERKLEDEWYGRGEQDVEHFRPKRTVKKWKVPRTLMDAGIQFTTPGDGKEEPGYHLLAYHLFNYCAACKPCNSAIKKNYFPIAGPRISSGDDPAQMQDEKPYLIYPIGSIDDDPEDLIRFYGVSPQPVYKNGYQRYRALVTIEFFKLDMGKNRKNLYRERAMIIILLRPFLKQKTKTAISVKRDEAQQIIDAATNPANPHTNCARSYVALYESNPAEGEEIYNLAFEYWISIS